MLVLPLLPVWGAIAGWAWWVQFVEALAMTIPGGVVLSGITLGNIVLSIVAGIVAGIVLVGILLVDILLRMAAV